MGNPVKADRNAAILDAAAAGASYAEIARRFDLSKARVGQIVGAPLLSAHLQIRLGARSVAVTSSAGPRAALIALTSALRGAKLSFEVFDQKGEPLTGIQAPAQDGSDKRGYRKPPPPGRPRRSRARKTTT